jgi:hypothetical protein
MLDGEGAWAAMLRVNFATGNMHGLTGAELERLFALLMAAVAQDAPPERRAVAVLRREHLRFRFAEDRVPRAQS